jgi:hypothetical protein
MNTDGSASGGSGMLRLDSTREKLRFINFNGMQTLARKLFGALRLLCNHFINFMGERRQQIEIKATGNLHDFHQHKHSTHKYFLSAVSAAHCVGFLVQKAF